MSTSKNGLDAFERSLRENLDQFEVPYNSADWTQMERTLNGGRRGWWVSGIGLSVLVAGLVVVGGGAWYTLNGTSANAGGVAGEKMEASVPTATEDATAGKTMIADRVVTMSENVTTTAASEPSSKVALEPAKDASHGASKHQVSAMRPATTGAMVATAKGKDVQPAGTTVSAPTAASPNEITFKASVAEGCPGTAVEFKVTNMSEDGIYLWNFGDGSFSNHANPEHTFTKPGRYQVMLSMSAAGVGRYSHFPCTNGRNPLHCGLGPGPPDRDPRCARATDRHTTMGGGLAHDHHPCRAGKQSGPFGSGPRSVRPPLSRYDP